MKIYQWIILSILLISCSEEEATGIPGQWEGTILINLASGETVTSDIESTITEEGDTNRACELTISGTVYKFEAEQMGDLLNYKNQPVTNVDSTTAKTYIDGTAELVGDSMLVFDHVIYSKAGNSLISTDAYQFSMKRK